MIRARLFVLLLAAVVLVCAGCSKDDPVKVQVKDPWPDMTSRDDVVSALLFCYSNPTQSKTMQRYEGLLHSQYYFVLSEDDVRPGEDPILSRAHDISVTQLIFENQTDLVLSIPEEGTWLERPDIDGGPCGNCWDTTRSYYIRAQFGAENTIYVSPPERAFVTIVVAPDESDPSKWVIRAMYDLGI